MKHLIVGLFAAVLSLAAFAAKTTTWQGAADASWNVAGNWDNGVPESGDTVILTGTSSVNDIAGLTLASLQFAGDSAVTLSGQAITLTAGDTSLTTAGAGTFTVALGLVLPEGENTFVIGNAADLELTGTISGAGALTFLGSNTVSDPNTITRETATLTGVVRLHAANTYAGGTKLVGAHLQIYDNGCFGPADTTVTFADAGSSTTYKGVLLFRAAGTFPYDISSSDISGTRLFNVVAVELTGDITLTARSYTLFVGNGKDVSGLNMTFRGTINAPYSEIKTYGKNHNFHYYGKVKVLQIVGNGGATGGVGSVWLYNPENEISNFVGSGSTPLYCGETNVIRNADLSWSSYIGGSYIHLEGKDQTIRDIAWSVRTVDGPNYLGAEWWTKTDRMMFYSSSPATLTMQPTKSSVTDMGFAENVSFTYDPSDDFTLTLISNRTHTTTGTLAVNRGTVAVTGFATFKQLTGIRVAAGATMDFSEQTVDPLTDGQVDFDLATGATLALRPNATWKAKSVTVGGAALKPGTYTHATLPELSDNGGVLSLPFTGGDYAFAEDLAVPGSDIGGVNNIVVSNGVTLTFNETPARLAGGQMFVTTIGTGKVVCDAAKGVFPGVWFFLNGYPAQFNATTGVLEISDYSAAGGKALLQNTAAAKTDDLGGATTNVEAVARLAETGDYTIGNGTVSASCETLVLDNRDTAGDLAITATFAPGSALLRKLGAGLVALPSDSSWSATAQIDAGALAVETTDGRLVVTVEPSQTQLTLSASSGAASVTATENAAAVTTDEKATVNRLDVAPTAADVSAKMTVTDAKLTFSGTGAGIAVGSAASENLTGCAELDFTNTTSYLDNSLGLLQVASKYGDGIVRVGPGSVLTNRLMNGHYGHTGATYIHGGRMFLLNGTLCGQGGTGTDYGTQITMGEGYTEVRNGGLLELAGEVRCASQGYNDAVLDIANATSRYVQASSLFSNHQFHGCLAYGRTDIRVGRGGLLEVTDFPNNNVSLDAAYAGQFTATARDGGHIWLSKMYLHKTPESSAYETTLFNAVDGGQITISGMLAYTSLIPKSVYDYTEKKWLKFKMFLNLNGGIYKGGFFNAGDLAQYGGEPPIIDRAIVYAKGGTWIWPANTIVRPTIVAATGNGISEIPWTPQGGFIGAPVVKIEGDGEAASASALFDSATGYVTNIVVNAPGIDYTWATAVVTRAGATVSGEVIARIPCTLAPNANGPLVAGGGASSTISYVKGVVSCDELVISNGGFCVQCENAISTNTVVTLTHDEGQSAYIYRTNGGGQGSIHYHFAPKAIRGNGGVGWQYDNNMFVSGFPAEGAPNVSFGNATNNLENTWEVDCKAYADRRAAGLATEIYPARVNITAGAKIKFVNTSYLKASDRSYTLLTLTDGSKSYELLGDLPALASDSERLGSWRLMKKGNEILLKHYPGAVIFLR